MDIWWVLLCFFTIQIIVEKLLVFCCLVTILNVITLSYYHRLSLNICWLFASFKHLGWCYKFFKLVINWSSSTSNITDVLCSVHWVWSISLFFEFISLSSCRIWVGLYVLLSAVLWGIFCLGCWNKHWIFLWIPSWSVRISLRMIHSWIISIPARIHSFYWSVR